MPTKSATVSLSKISFHTLKKFYQDYCIDGAVFRKQAGAAIKLSGVLLNDARYANTNTCALRVSYALHRAGATLPHIPGRDAVYIGKHRSPAFLPSIAADYKDMLADDQVLKPNQRLTLNGKVGIILFLPSDTTAFGATGHVTLFEGLWTIDGNNQYFGDPRIKNIWYWVMNV